MKFATSFPSGTSVGRCSRPRRGSLRCVASTLLTITAALAAAAPGVALQSVHVVNGGGGGALQAAIDAAADGDTVLVHGGTFDACAIVGKSLTLVSEPTSSTQVAGLRVANTLPVQRTNVIGLHVVAPAVGVSGVSPDCIVLEQCAGSVRLQALTASLTAPNGKPALRATDAADVALVGCSLTGSNGASSTASTEAWDAGEGVLAQNSRIAAYECALVGGNGNDGNTVSQCSNPYTFPGTSGAAGVALDATSTWHSSGGSVRGGNGGKGFNARCDCFTAQLIVGSNGSAGGAGIENAAGSAASALGTLLSGGNAGQGGLPANCGGGPAGGGAPGSAGPQTTQSLTPISGQPMRLDAPTLVRAGQMLTFTIHGTPGDVALVGRSFETRWLPLLTMQGVLLIGPSGRRVPVGMIGGNGMVTISVPADLAVPGAQSAQWYLQCFARDPLGALQIGAAAVVTVLDPSF